jgi:hypothetical protein
VTWPEGTAGKGQWSGWPCHVRPNYSPGRSRSLSHWGLSRVTRQDGVRALFVPCPSPRWPPASSMAGGGHTGQGRFSLRLRLGRGICDLVGPGMSLVGPWTFLTRPLSSGHHGSGIGVLLWPLPFFWGVTKAMSATAGRRVGKRWWPSCEDGADSLHHPRRQSCPGRGTAVTGGDRRALSCPEAQGRDTRSSTRGPSGPGHRFLSSVCPLSVHFPRWPQSWARGPERSRGQGPLTPHPQGPHTEATPGDDPTHRPCTSGGWTAGEPLESGSADSQMNCHVAL